MNPLTTNATNPAGVRNLTFGQATSILANQLGGSSGTEFNSLYTVGGARSLKLAAKILFWTAAIIKPVAVSPPARSYAGRCLLNSCVLM